MDSAVRPITYLYGVAFLFLAASGFFLAKDGSLYEVFSVETSRNLLYVGSGLLALIAFYSGYAASRAYLIVMGVVYGILALLGYTLEGDILNVFQTAMNDTYLHLGVSVIALLIGMFSPSQKHL